MSRLSNNFVFVTIIKRCSEIIGYDSKAGMWCTSTLNLKTRNNKVVEGRNLVIKYVVRYMGR